MNKYFTILHLHRMGDPSRYRSSVYELEHIFSKSRTDCITINHDADLPFPEFLHLIKFDLIILGPTFLCVRYDRKLLKSIKDRYNFIGNMDSCKLALPQDDYDCSQVLDDWMMEWSIDLLYTICNDNWEILYPKFIKRGEIRLGYTGYITAEQIQNSFKNKPLAARNIDLSYRATRLPPYYGTLGNIKGEIPNLILGKIKDKHLNIDISVDENKMHPGVSWLNFLENSKACMVTPSGSSIFDPYGEIRNQVISYVRLNPKASFETIFEKFLREIDHKYTFTMISPRNFEAALLNTVQVAVKSDYSFILSPNIHYIPLEPDASNIDDVVLKIKDIGLLQQISAAAKEAVLSVDRLRAKNFCDEVLIFVEEWLGRNSPRHYNYHAHINYKVRYDEYIVPVSRRYWNLKRMEIRLKEQIKSSNFIKGLYYNFRKYFSV